MNGVCFTYGTYICGTVIYQVITKQRLFSQVFINRITGEEFADSYSLVFHYMMATHQIVCALFILAAVMGFVMFLFWGWHMYLALTNVTTNEKMKYSELESYLKHLQKQKQKKQQQQQQQIQTSTETPTETPTKTPTKTQPESKLQTQPQSQSQAQLQTQDKNKNKKKKKKKTKAKTKNMTFFFGKKKC